MVHNTVMRGYVGVTDDEWYRFLAARPEISRGLPKSWGVFSQARGL